MARTIKAWKDEILRKRKELFGKQRKQDTDAARRLAAHPKFNKMEAWEVDAMIEDDLEEDDF